MGAARLSLEGDTSRAHQLADHARRVVHYIMGGGCFVKRRGGIVAMLGVVRRRGIRGRRECVRVKRIRVAGHLGRVGNENAVHIVIGVVRIDHEPRLGFDVVIENHRRALQEGLIDSAPSGIHKIEVVVQARGVAQALRGRDRSVGMAIQCKVAGNLLLTQGRCARVIDQRVLGVVDRAGAVPVDDCIAIRIVQRTEVNLALHEIKIGKIESERLQNIARGHDISPVEWSSNFSSVVTDQTLMPTLRRSL